MVSIRHFFLMATTNFLRGVPLWVLAKHSDQALFLHLVLSLPGTYFFQNFYLLNFCQALVKLLDKIRANQAIAVSTFGTKLLVLATLKSRQFTHKRCRYISVNFAVQQNRTLRLFQQSLYTMQVFHRTNCSCLK